MDKTTNRVECAHCGSVLRDGNTSPCPECGKKGRRILMELAGQIDVAAHVTWEKRREFYEQRPLALVSVIALTIGAPFLGLVLVGWAGVIAGLMLGAVAYWVGTFAITKVREIERGG